MNKKNTRFKLLLSAVGLIAVSAVLFLYPYSPKNPPVADDQGATIEGEKEVVQGNNQFSFDLYQEMNKQESGNVFYSPYSIFSALAMTYEGAENETAQEMKSVFYFPSKEELRPNFALVYNKINQASNDAYELRTGNALWVQHDYSFLDGYLSRVESYYGGKAANLDFVKEPEKSRNTINSFIAEQTNDKIKDLISASDLDSGTRMVLTNAIYFKGLWEYEFKKDRTREEDFKVSDDQTVKVEMMELRPEEDLNYAETEDLQIIELPYQGEKVSMFVILPREDLSQLEPLNEEKFREWQGQMQERPVDSVYLPKFKFKTKYYLKDVLVNMGMSNAFNPGLADFSGMTRGRDLFIDFVVHQAFVEVDEKGTEAAAATGVGMKLTAVMPQYQRIFNADHPFIFVLQDNETDSILFLGKVVDPRE